MSRLPEPSDQPDAATAPRAPADPWLRLRYRIEFAFFLAVAKAAAALPLETCAAWSAWCWRQLGRFNSRSRRALDQIERAMPELSAGQRQAIVTQMWDNLGRVFAESFHLPEFVDDPSRCETLRQDELLDFIEAHPRVLIVAMHSANWELTALAAPKAGLRIAGIYQAIKNPFVDAYVTRLRRPLYPAGLFPKTPDTPRRLIRRMREGVTVAMLSDQREVRGVEVPFFGRPAPSTSFPALIAVAHDIPIVAVRMLRLPNSRFRCDWRVIETARGGSREEKVRATTARIQSCFEGWVRERPGEWMWVHRRWA